MFSPLQVYVTKMPDKVLGLLVPMQSAKENQQYTVEWDILAVLFFKIVCRMGVLQGNLVPTDEREEEEIVHCCIHTSSLCHFSVPNQL